MKKKKALIIALWLAVLAVAVMIFVFSAQDAISSMRTSDAVTYWLIRLRIPGYDQLPQKEQDEILQQYSYVVRKAAHFTEFALLGLFLRLLFNALSLRWQFIPAWAAGTLYAATDELHQLLLGTRSGMWQDVCIDSGGVLFGALIAMGILALCARWKKKKGAESQ